MSGLLADLSVAGKLALRVTAKRLRAQLEPPPDLQRFQHELNTLLSQAPPGIIRDVHWLDLPANQPPWTATGLQLNAGDEVTYFSAGRAYANRLLDIYVRPAVQLWCKVGPVGEVFRGTRASHSFCAQHDGELQLGNYFPNDWADKQGQRVQDDSVYRSVSGTFKVLVIRWQDGAAQGLAALCELDATDGPLQQELERLQQGDITPPGWRYLWHLGPAEIYRQHRDAVNGDCIHCQTHADVGILQKDAPLPLLESSELSWRWCVKQLPSTLREDTVPSHDYLSIAVEFDNGRDITYHWSNALPVDTGYDCPLPNWSGKEFHVVVRNGSAGLGQWQEERRNLYQDYLTYMGEPPAKIVKVWLIANSIFQRGSGACDYADIEVASGEQRLKLL